MSSNLQESVLSWAEVEQLVDAVVEKIIASTWHPDIIIALSRGGFIPATMIAYKLKVKNLAGLDARKNSDGVRSTGYIVTIKDLDQKRVLIVDDGIILRVTC